MPTREYLGIEQVARRLNLNTEFVQDLLERHELPGIRLGAAWLIPEPELDAFLEAEFRRQNAVVGVQKVEVMKRPASRVRRPRSRRGSAHAVSVSFQGQTLEMPNYTAGVVWIVEQLAAKEAMFLERLGTIRRGKRRYVSRNRDELYANRPDLPATRMKNGWWIGTNYSRVELEKLLRIACRLARIEFDADVKITPFEAHETLDPARSFIGIGHSGLGDLARRHDDYLTEP